tara:strand:+ start:217 stop:405 length:189 start_codon:yes stop_codon:yes gene_type:complete
MKVYIVKHYQGHKAFANKKDAIKYQSHLKRGIADLPEIDKSTTRIQMDIPITSKGIIKALNF